MLKWDKEKWFTCGSGQQPHFPDESLQQVEPSGHAYVSSHFSLDGAIAKVGTFATQGTDTERSAGSSQLPAATLHTVSCGQQWMWSSQHTAWRWVQHHSKHHFMFSSNKNGRFDLTVCFLEMKLTTYLWQRTASPGAFLRFTAGGTTLTCYGFIAGNQFFCRQKMR